MSITDPRPLHELNALLDDAYERLASPEADCNLEAEITELEHEYDEAIRKGDQEDEGPYVVVLVAGVYSESVSD